MLPSRFALTGDSGIGSIAAITMQPPDQSAGCFQRYRRKG
ncbi:hypothetical protein HMPREF9098_2436 [Kingella denitrificans ATCC 33394]|uniref:Uncharacterized protein n=1 Tax=Kingella denitrificans ATCC 33394 TaxID=888741 RepID=F0F2V1_9NEIS|nr:hypothetical protein HMPREF9098_2436 [Kingella denitrificans ATCC 33394]